MQRVPPRTEYLELLPHPAAKRKYTEKDIQTKILTKVNTQSHEKEEGETNIQSAEGTTRKPKQAPRMSSEDPEERNKKGLVSSLRASAKGTKTPHKDGLFGPLRNMIYARTLRSKRVKKATATKRKRRLTMEDITHKT